MERNLVSNSTEDVRVRRTTLGPDDLGYTERADGSTVPIGSVQVACPKCGGRTPRWQLGRNGDGACHDCEERALNALVVAALRLDETDTSSHD